MTQAHLSLSAQAAHRLTLNTEPYLSCDDCFELVDTYAEALLSDPDFDLPAMGTHLAGCAACVEEARSLIQLVAEQDGVDPVLALRRIEDDDLT